MEHCARRTHGARLRHLAVVAWLVAASGCVAGSPSDVELQAARAGIVYRQTLAAARTDDAALRLLLELADDVNEVGADEYGGDLLGTLALIGERRFLIALTSVDPGVRAAVLDVLRYQSGYDHRKSFRSTWLRFQDAFPAVAAVVEAAAMPHGPEDEHGE